MEQLADKLEVFVGVVREYCDVIEKADEYSRQRLIRRVRELLPQLYFYALHLPETVSELSIDRVITHEQWSEVFGGLIGKLGSCDMYWEIFNPSQQTPKEPVCGSLADDLADIYRDLKEGLLEWDKGNENIRAAVVWEWRFGFENHWGDHLVDGLRGLNWLIKDRQLTD